MTKQVTILTAAVLFSLIFPLQMAFASVVIYYDDVAQEGKGIQYANMMMNLVGHFDGEVSTNNVEGYPTGNLALYDYGIYLGMNRVSLPEEFLSDVARKKTRFLWIGANFDQLVNHVGDHKRLGMIVSGWSPGENYNQIRYGNRILSRAIDPSHFMVEKTGDAKILSTMISESDSEIGRPHFICSGKLCYLVQNPLPYQLQDDRYLLFADLLHEFFQTDVPRSKLAMVRMEDRAPGVTDPKKMRFYGREFQSRGIPFSVAVLPVYTDPKGKYGEPRTFTLNDTPDFVEAIKFLQEAGGDLVMHGYSHQRGDGVSREDWEFSQGMNNQPTLQDSDEFVRDKIVRGVKMFNTEGLEPRIWETPHYSASHGDYKVIAEFFDAFYERPLVFPLHQDTPAIFGQQLNPVSQILPYYSRTSQWGKPFLPENLGYINSNIPNTASDALLSQAEKISLVRDGVASFYFHDSTPETDVWAVVDGLLERGYTFVSPSDYINPDDSAVSLASSRYKAKLAKLKDGWNSMSSFLFESGQATFISLRFAIFFLIVFAIYWLVRKWKNARVVVLVVASYGFYAGWNVLFAAVILFVSVLDYYLGKSIASSKSKSSATPLLVISIIVNVGLIAAYKYLSFHPEVFGELGQESGLLPQPAHYSIPYLLGLSFFLFQSLSYTINLYRKNSQPAESLLDYLAYIAFFPRLLAGPVVRADDFLPQLKQQPALSPERRSLALFLLASGVVKKVVFADYLALNLVDKVFDLPTLFSTTEVILALYGYTLQIYCELSGFTDIALALGLFLGFQLPNNFRFPYQASNLRAFWRRWFISISSWFKDYIYIPLGGNKGRIPGGAYITPVLTMVLVGLWCGPTKVYLSWGLIWGIGIALTVMFHRMTGKNGNANGGSGIFRFVGIFFTFHFLVFTWALFRSFDIQMFKDLLSILELGIWGAPNITMPVISILVLGMIGAWFPSKLFDKAQNLFGKLPLPVQLALVAVIFLVVFKVSASEAVPFVYERF